MFPNISCVDNLIINTFFKISFVYKIKKLQQNPIRTIIESINIKIFS